MPVIYRKTYVSIYIFLYICTVIEYPMPSAEVTYEYTLTLLSFTSLLTCIWKHICTQY